MITLQINALTNFFDTQDTTSSSRKFVDGATMLVSQLLQEKIAQI
jgi:hypothetical protein